MFGFESVIAGEDCVNMVRIPQLLSALIEGKGATLTTPLLDATAFPFSLSSVDRETCLVPPSRSLMSLSL